MMNNDIISRNAVLKCLCVQSFRKLAKVGLSPEGNLAEYRRRIKELPSIDIEKKVGRWLPPSEHYDSKIWRKCSCCGTNVEVFSKYITYAGDISYIARKMNYCNICGAEMENAQEMRTL